MNESLQNEVATIEHQLTQAAPIALAPEQFTPAALAMNPAVFEHMQRVAKMYAASQWAPDHYKGKVADCCIAISMACTLGVNPVVFLQRTYPVKGRIGFEGQLATALVNTSGKYQHSLRFDISGKDEALQVVAWTLTKSGDRLEGKYTMQMAIAAGLTREKKTREGFDLPNPYKVIPEQKLCYMAALMFVRLHCPELLMGMAAVEELDVVDVDELEAREFERKLGKK